MIGDINIEAYDTNGRYLPGNGDGQALLRGFKDYRRANAYKRIKTLPKEQLSLNGRAVFYRVIRDDGTHGSILEEIRK